MATLDTARFESQTQSTPGAYSPPGALFSSVLYLTVAIFQRGTWALLAASVLVWLGQLVYVRRVEPAAFLVRVTLPLAIPLLAIHGVLNPQFRPDLWLLGFIPIRGAGVAFATSISARLFLVAAAMTVWRQTAGSQVISFFQRLGLPSAVITVFALATSSVSVVQQRGRSVYLAQQARGINFRASVLSRVVGLPKLVIPVAVATLVESAERGVAMESRGLGCGPWQLTQWYSPPSVTRLLAEMASALIVLASVAFR